MLKQKTTLLQNLINKIRPNQDVRAARCHAEGLSYFASGDLEQSFESFRQYARLTYGNNSDKRCPNKTSSLKGKHDREQYDYLRLRGLIDASSDPDNFFNLADAPRVQGRAVHAEANDKALTTSWQSASPRIVVLDNFLTHDALVSLRSFCLESTIWRQPFASGYLGALPDYGLGTPLLAQIGYELRETYPVIFAAQPLKQLWGFKYDQQGEGINIHADFAAVNVNFWITPDSANNDPNSGGLVLWDKPVPTDWNFADYNDNPEQATRFLAEVNAKPITVPYRCNRAVIFDSSLFHKTDRIDFRDGYENRRINLTLLYGRRGV
jgi:hypothetical protein